MSGREEVFPVDESGSESGSRLGTVGGDKGPGSSPDIPFITLLGNPVLRSRCHPVDEFGAELSELIDDMFRCLAAIAVKNGAFTRYADCVEFVSPDAAICDGNNHN